MKTLKPTSQFKKDLKRYRNNSGYIAELMKVLGYLERDLPIPQHYKPHVLTGDCRGCMECHVKNDFLLIWIDPENNMIDLVSLGSHSELYGKGVKK
ncbi:MAG: type II toxin-antitoxin system YafQ family toxin [Muribaculaceae bacterium]